MVYNDKINRELQMFENNINANELPEAFHYCTEKYLRKQLMDSIGVSSFEALINKHINILKVDKDEANIKICSLGSGNCDIEIGLVRDCEFRGKIYCYDVNSNMLERGRKLANDNDFHNFEFINCDINDIQLNQEFDIVLAHHSLHHFVKLENIFDEVNKCMTKKSFFIISDIIGRNGHMFWDNAFEICNAIWNIFPKELKYNVVLKKYCGERIQWDCSNEGFEGIKAQDILPLLDEKFKFKDFAPFFAIVSRFTDRDFGGNFDLTNNYHKSLLDMICNFDDFALKNKILKPTQLIAVMVKKDVEIVDYKYLYFKDAKEIYAQSEQKFWDKFDHPRKIKFNRLKAEIDEWEKSYNSIVNSTCWKITKPLRLIADFFKNILNTNTSDEF